MTISRAPLTAAVLGVVFLAVYLPQAGHGFIQDDFRWILESRVHSVRDAWNLLFADLGFYRPLVSLSFALDYWLWGLNPAGYALTNTALCLLASVLIYALARAFGLSRAASIVAGAVWLFNFHGVNMAVLWISGRTALLVSVFSLLCAHAVVRGRYASAGLLTLAAALSKEEAVMLPPLCAAFLAVSERRVRAALRTAPMWAAVAVYIVLRLQSDAFWPGTAPSYYRLSLAPGLIGRNIAEYADRAATVAVVAALAFAIAARNRPSDLNSDERRVLVFGALWVPFTFAITVLVPVRSSLYALLPSIGSALIAGAISAAAQRTDHRRFVRLATALVVVVALLTPVYRARNRRWVVPAELSNGVMTALVRELRDAAPGHVALIDDPSQRFNLATAFGGLFPSAIELHLGRAWTGEVVAADANVGSAKYVYRLTGGTVVRHQQRGAGLLPRGPGERATRQQMKMDVEHRLSRVSIAVQNRAVPAL